MNAFLSGCQKILPLTWFGQLSVKMPLSSAFICCDCIPGVCILILVYFDFHLQIFKCVLKANRAQKEAEENEMERKIALLMAIEAHEGGEKKKCCWPNETPAR